MTHNAANSALQACETKIVLPEADDATVCSRHCPGSIVGGQQIQEVMLTKDGTFDEESQEGKP